MLRQPSINEPTFYFRVIYDLLFYVLVIIIVLNLIFGVIIDTFADLRGELFSHSNFKLFLKDAMIKVAEAVTVVRQILH